MAQTLSFEEAIKDAPSALDMALQAEGITGKVADIARSIYQQESGSGANTSTSNRGAVGGMQILPGTFKRMADKGWDIKDPVHNARAGIRYVQEMHDLAGGDPALTAAGYYGGTGGLEKARKGIAVSDPVNPGAPNTLEYGQQVAARIPSGPVAQALDKVASAIIPSANAQEAPAATKKAPRTISFEEAQQGAPEPAAAPAPAKRSMIDELGRQLGLTARAAVTGVASIPAMASDAVTGPINAGLDAVAGKGNGFRFQRASDALNNILTKAGVPVPENATERVVQDAASSVAGAGGMIKGGLALANSAAGPVARGVGELLATGPGLQLASAATGSGASGVVRENGGGEGAQIVAGLAGSMVPSVAPYAKDAIIRGALRGGEAGRQRVADTIKTFEDAAGTVPTLGQATGSRPLQAAETALTNTVGSSGVMVRRADEQAKALGDSVQKLTTALAPDASGADAGTAIAAGAKAFRDNVKTTQQRLYADLDNHIPAETRITSDRTRAALADLNTDIAGAPALSKWFKNARIQGIEGGLKSDTGSIDAVLTRPGMADKVASMRGQLEEEAARITAANAERQSLGMKNLEPVLTPAQIQEKIDGFLTQQIDSKLPYESVKKLRTLVGRELADTSLASDVPRSKWRALYGALSDDLGDAAKAAGPKAEQVWARANKYTKAAMERMDQLDTIVNRDTPEKIFKAATTGMADGGTTIRRVMQSMPLDNRREVTAAVLQRLGKAKNGLQNEVGDVFSSETFLTNLAAMSPAARKAIFDSSGFPGLGEKIATMGRMSSVRRDGSKVFSNPSGTARQVGLTAWMSGLFSGISTGNPATIAGALAVPALANVAAKKATSPSFVKYLGEKTILKEGAQAAAVGAATRATGTPQQPAPAPRSFTWEEAQHPADAQSAPRVELKGTAQPGAAEPIPGQTGSPETGQGAQPEQPVSSVDGGQVAPDGAQQQEVAQHPAPEFDPATVFTSQPRDDGTLAVQGDGQALREVLVASGIPARSIVPIRGGILVGRSQASKVQSAIDALHSPAADVAQTSDQNQQLALADTAQAAMDSGAIAEPQAAPIDVAAHGAATSPHNDLPEPTEAQKRAGNYQLGHDRIAGMDVSIENPQGSVRRGVDADGTPWETQMQHHYGYFKGTTANDGDKLDVFIKPGTPRDYAGPVFVIDQVDPKTGALDEHKTILGAKDEEEAKAIYRANYAADWNGMGSITRLPMPAFKAWAANGDKKHPLGDLQAPADEHPAVAEAVPEQPAEPAPAVQPEPSPPQDTRLATIQRLHDSGEGTVAAMLQREHDRAQTLESARSELANMRDRTPDLPHHGDPAFNDHYQQRRLAGAGPAEASAHAGITAGVHEIASKIGLPDPALKALTVKLQDMPIEDAPGFVERFTQKLIDKGVMKPFPGADQIASILTHARDQAMHGAVGSLYGVEA